MRTHDPSPPSGRSDRPVDSLDVVVIGAGQAGLAIGWHLAQQRLRFVLVDGAPALGHSWRRRWDSLRLFSPARYDSLPGLDFPGAPDSHPTKDQVAEYLTAYAETFQLPVLLGHQVTRLTHDPSAGPDEGRFTVHTDQGPLRARQVVVATGAFQAPSRPALASALSDRVLQLHSSDYRNPGQLPPGPVLVVGGGNSGLQIAEELAVSRGADVHLAVGSTPPALPQRFAGRDLFWWLARTGAISRPATSFVARRMRARGELVIGTSRKRVARAGATVHPRVTAAGPDRVTFADGERLAPASVVWATGFVPDYRWLEVPGVLDATGSVVHERGVTDVPGLYFIGLPWQHTRGSALLGFVRHDAAWLADRVHTDRLRAELLRPAAASRR